MRAGAPRAAAEGFHAVSERKSEGRSPGLAAAMRVLLRVAAAGALAILLGCGHGEPPRGSIQGWVYVPSAVAQRSALLASRSPVPPQGYRPAAGAAVVVTGSSASTGTNAQGYYRIDHLKAGQHTVGVSLSGYYAVSFAVQVAGGRLVTAGRDDGSTLLQPAQRKWTVMVFLNADNDLETFGIQDVNEMEMVGSSGAVDIVVQMDRIPGYDASNGNWTDCRRFRVVKDPAETDPAAREPLSNTIVSPVLEDLGEVDMGQPQTLHDFIAWAQAAFPAEHYLLVLWDHGSGWLVRERRRQFQRPPLRAVSYDYTSDTFISTTALPQGLTTWPQPDVIAFDASLMQMVEVAYEIRGQGRLMVGSEDSPPGPGYAYQTFLRQLVANPAMTPAELTGHIVNDTIAFYGSASGVTQSSADLGQIGAVRLALQNFAVALEMATPAHGAQIASARAAAQAFAYPENKDLYDFARLCGERVDDQRVKDTAAAMLSAIQSAVIAEAHGSARPGSHGLAIYLPTPANYSSTYGLLALSRDTVWDDWLPLGPK